MLGISQRFLRGGREKLEDQLKRRIAAAEHLKKQGLKLYSEGDYDAGLECLFASLDGNGGDFELQTHLREKSLAQSQRLNAQGKQEEAAALMERLKSRLPIEDSKSELAATLSGKPECPLQSVARGEVKQFQSQTWAGHFTPPSPLKESAAMQIDSLSSEESEIITKEEEGNNLSKSMSTS